MGEVERQDFRFLSAHAFGQRASAAVIRLIGDLQEDIAFRVLIFDLLMALYTTRTLSNAGIFAEYCFLHCLTLKLLLDPPYEKLRRTPGGMRGENHHLLADYCWLCVPPRWVGLVRRDWLSWT